MQNDYLSQEKLITERCPRIASRQIVNRKRVEAKSPFEKDLLAMQEVWKMLKAGAIRWFGEVGRRY